MHNFFLVSRILRIVFPRQYVYIRVLDIVQNTYFNLYDPLHLHALMLTVRNNVFKVYAPSDYIHQSGPIRILLINDSVNMEYRVILGYIVLTASAMNPILIYCKPITFSQGIIPDIYHSQTVFCLCVRYDIEFHTVVNLNDDGCLWDATEVLFMQNRIIATRNVIAYYNHGSEFEIFKNEQCRTMKELKEAMKKVEFPTALLVGDGNYTAIGM